MMIHNVYAVYDEASKLFKYDFKRSRHGEASRFFSDAVQSKGTELHCHPHDFSLFYLAQYDDETGRFSNLDIPERISRAIDFVGVEPKEAPNGGGNRT